MPASHILHRVLTVAAASLNRLLGESQVIQQSLIPGVLEEAVFDNAEDQVFAGFVIVGANFLRRPGHGPEPVRLKCIVKVRVAPIDDCVGLVVSAQNLVVGEGTKEELDLAEAGAEGGALRHSHAARIRISLSSPILVLNTP